MGFELVFSKWYGKCFSVAPLRSVIYVFALFIYTWKLHFSNCSNQTVYLKKKNAEKSGTDVGCVKQVVNFASCKFCLLRFFFFVRDVGTCLGVNHERQSFRLCKQTSLKSQTNEVVRVTMTSKKIAFLAKSKPISEIFHVKAEDACFAQGNLVYKRSSSVSAQLRGSSPILTIVWKRLRALLEQNHKNSN